MKEEFAPVGPDATVTMLCSEGCNQKFTVLRKDIGTTYLVDRSTNGENTSFFSARAECTVCGATAVSTHVGQIATNLAELFGVK